MKGYYTVRLVADGFTAAQRMAIEARYVRALEAALGGHEEAVRLMLEAAQSEESRERVRAACAQVQGALCAEPGLEAARFQVQASAAVDLG
jgi:hypothetical protein